MYNQDTQTAKENLRKYWDREPLKRAIIATATPKPNASPIPKHTDTEQKWHDIEFRYQQFEAILENTIYHGEALPHFWSNMGPGAIAACVSGEYVLAESTVWFDRNPIIKDWSNPPELKLNKQSKMWKHLTELTTYFSDRANGRYTCGISDIGGNLDILAALRGTDNLLYDLYDEPNAVKAAVELTDDLFIETYNHLDAIVSRNQSETNTWMGIWSPYKWYPLQCDFSAMISPDQFGEFVLPSITKMTKFLERSIYHLDGPGEIPHLDQLLDIEDLTGIQWVPGAGAADCLDEQWLPMYKKIQDKGKNLVLNSSKPHMVIPILRELNPTGVFVSTSVEDAKQAEQILDDLEKLN